MASSASYTAPVASASASTSLTATFSEAASTFTATQGLVAMVRRYSSTSTDPTPPTPAGWTLIAGGVNNNAGATTRLWEGIFARQGDGSTRSITITGASATTVISLVSFAGIKAATFWRAAVEREWISTAISGSTLSFDFGALDAIEAGSTLIGHIAVGGTFGGTGPTWTGATRITGGSGTSTSSYAIADVPSATSDPTLSVSWTNQTLTRAVAVILDTGVAAPAVTYPRAYIFTGGVKEPARIRGLWTGGAENVLSSWRIHTASGPSTERVPYLDPYEPQAWPNIAIGSGALFESATATITSAWINGTVPEVNKEAWSIAPFTSTTSDPIVELRQLDGTTVTKTITGVYAKSTAAATAGTDKHVLLVQPNGYSAYEVFKFARPSTGVITGTVIRGPLNLRGKANDTGTRAFGWSGFIGLIRHHELAALDIPHVIALAGPNSFLKAGPVWPAKWEDGDAATAYKGVTPIGTAFGIPPSVNVANLGLSPEGLALATALQDYGGIITDRAGTGAAYMEPGGTAAQVAAYERMRTDYKAKIHRELRRITNNNPGTLTNWVPNDISGVMGGGTRRRPFKAAFPPL